MTGLTAGQCPHCGQGYFVEIEAEATRKDFDVAVMRKCGCHKARRTIAMMDIEAKVEELFGEQCLSNGFDAIVGREGQERILQIYEWIYDGKIDGISVTLPGGDRVIIRDKQGLIKIEREHKIKSTT